MNTASFLSLTGAAVSGLAVLYVFARLRRISEPTFTDDVQTAMTVPQQEMLMSDLLFDTKEEDAATAEQISRAFNTSLPDYTRFRARLLKSVAGRYRGTDTPHINLPTKSRSIFFGLSDTPDARSFLCCRFSMPEREDLRIWSHAYLDSNLESLLKSARELPSAFSTPVVWRIPIGIDSSYSSYIVFALLWVSADKLAPHLRELKEHEIGQLLPPERNA